MIFYRLKLLVLLAVCSCKAYKQDIMFQFDDDFSVEDLSTIKNTLDQNYKLKPNDVFWLDLFTNKGEGLVDPNFEFLTRNQTIQQQALIRDRFQYVIQADSIVMLPMVGSMNLVGMSLYEAELKIASAFETYYDSAFAKLRIANRRVFVLGASGGQVVPLENENTTLIEVLALSKGLKFGARAQNIRLIRGEQVFLIDLSTITGMKKSNIKVEPGDIVYVEPWRRPWIESIRDVGPSLSIISTAITLIILIQNL